MMITREMVKTEYLFFVKHKGKIVYDNKKYYENFIIFGRNLHHYEWVEFYDKYLVR